MFALGLMRAGAAPLALVQSLNPILTALLGGPLLGEWLRLRQWLGLVLGAVGASMSSIANRTTMSLAVITPPTSRHGMKL
jgi:drug/metabolite transporter (DMT)-like permease